MTRERFKELHRAARAGNLGTLACTLPDKLYHWFLLEVYDLRFPHVGDDRRRVDELIQRRAFDSMRHGGTTQRQLAEWHYSHGWINCYHKSLLRLWVEFKAMSQSKEAA